MTALLRLQATDTQDTFPPIRAMKRLFVLLCLLSPRRHAAPAHIAAAGCAPPGARDSSLQTGIHMMQMTPMWDMPVGGALYGPLALLQGGQPLRILPLQGLQLLQLVRQRLHKDSRDSGAGKGGRCPARLSYIAGI